MKCQILFSGEKKKNVQYVVYRLRLIMLGTSSAEKKKKRFGISYKFSPKENNLHEMVKTLFSRENMKTIVSISSAELGQRVVKVNKKQRVGILELTSNMIGHSAITTIERYLSYLNFNCGGF